MTPSRLRALLDTVGVLVLVGALPLSAIASPPDPVTQLYYLAITVPATIAVAALLVYGADYRRIRFEVRSIVVILLSMVAAAFLAQIVVGVRWTLVATAIKSGAAVLGLAAGIWLAYHDGLARLRAAVT